MGNYIANRRFNQFRYSYEQDLVDIYGSCSIGASGAVTSGTVAGKGVSGVVKESTAGQYSITFTDTFPKWLSLEASVLFTTATGVANIDILMDPTTIQADILGDKTIVIQLYDYAGAAVNAASGSLLSFKATFRNSSVG